MEWTIQIQHWVPDTPYYYNDGRFAGYRSGNWFNADPAAETVTHDGPAGKVAVDFIDDFRGNQDVVDPGTVQCRVLVWPGADADIGGQEPAAVQYIDEL